MAKAQLLIQMRCPLEHCGGLQIAALITGFPREGESLEDESAPESFTAQLWQKVHLLQFAHRFLCTLQWRYAAAAEDYPLGIRDDPIGPPCTLVQRIEMIELGIGDAVPLGCGESMFGGDLPDHLGNRRFILQLQRPDGEPLLQVVVTQAAQIEHQSLMQQLLFVGRQLLEYLGAVVIQILMQFIQERLPGRGETQLLAPAIAVMGLASDEVPLLQAAQGAAGVGFIDPQPFGELIVGQRSLFQLDQQMGFDWGERGGAALGGKHTQFSNQFSG